MKNATYNARILIAALPGSCQNYEQALKKNGFSVLFPTSPGDDIPYVLSKLYHLNFDLLLLPGGGDISPLLYTSTDSQSLPSDADKPNSPEKVKCDTPDYVTDILQFQLIQLAMLRKKPVLGICKGMQVLNVWFGGDLHPHLPTADLHTSEKGDLMHPLSLSPHFPDCCYILGRGRNASQQLYYLLKQTPIVNSAHHQGVRTLGEDLLTLQYSDDYLPETIAHRHLPVLGLQWHPERLPGFRENSLKKLIELLLQSSVL